MKLLVSVLVFCVFLLFPLQTFSQDSNISREQKSLENECLIDPVEVFDKWTLTGYDLLNTPYGIVYDAYYEGNEKSPVKYVNLMIFTAYLLRVPHGICSLAYLYNGDLIFFSYNEKLKKYEKYEPEEETKDLTWDDFKEKFGVSRGKKI